MLGNDPILISILNNKEIKEMNKSFGELDLNSVIVYNSTTNSNAAVSINFTIKLNANSKTSTEAVNNKLIVYLKNDAPNIITIQQLSGVNEQTNSGQIQYYSPIGDELLSLTVDNGKYTSIKKAAVNGDTKNPTPRETWTECMKRAAEECADDWACAVTCIFMSVPCSVGFGLGCALQQA